MSPKSAFLSPGRLLVFNAPMRLRREEGLGSVKAVFNSSGGCFACTQGNVAARLPGEPRSRARGVTPPRLLARGASLTAGAPKGGEPSLPHEKQGRRKVEGRSFLSTDVSNLLSNPYATFNSSPGARNPSCSLCHCQNLQHSSGIPGGKNPQRSSCWQPGWTGLGGMSPRATGAACPDRSTPQQGARTPGPSCHPLLVLLRQPPLIPAAPLCPLPVCSTEREK